MLTSDPAPTRLVPQQAQQQLQRMLLAQGEYIQGLMQSSSPALAAGAAGEGACSPRHKRAHSARSRAATKRAKAQQEPSGVSMRVARPTLSAPHLPYSVAWQPRPSLSAPHLALAPGEEGPAASDAAGAAPGPALVTAAYPSLATFSTPSAAAAAPWQQQGLIVAAAAAGGGPPAAAGGPGAGSTLSVDPAEALQRVLRGLPIHEVELAALLGHASPLSDAQVGYAAALCCAVPRCRLLGPPCVGMGDFAPSVELACRLLGHWLGAACCARCGMGGRFPRACCPRSQLDF